MFSTHTQLCVHAGQIVPTFYLNKDFLVKKLRYACLVSEPIQCLFCVNRTAALSLAFSPSLSSKLKSGSCGTVVSLFLSALALSVSATLSCSIPSWADKKQPLSLSFFIFRFFSIPFLFFFSFQLPLFFCSSTFPPSVFHSPFHDLNTFK